MKKALLIAEKPDAAKKIKKVYEKIDYIDNINFTSARGHLIRLAYPEEYNKKEWSHWSLEDLPIIPEEFIYLPIENAKSYLKNIENELNSKKYDYVINACDAAKEGELIFELIYQYLDCKLPVKRMWLNEFTEKGIINAFENLKEDSEMKNLKLAAKYRQWFDWLLGINLTRVSTIKTNQKIPIGRVMTPTLAILANRELEIKNFVPTNYWELECEFKEGFTSLWIDNNKETKIESKEKAEQILGKISKASNGTIINITKKENTTFQSSLYDLGELQKEANHFFGYSLSKTLNIAQQLYEKHNLISYPRTDSKFLNKNITNEFISILKTINNNVKDLSKFTNKILNNENIIANVSNNKKYIDDSKVTDHYAIIPTEQKLDINNLSTEEKNIYLLVVKRFLSIFMPGYKTSTTSIITDIQGEKFKTESKILLDLGYKELYPSKDKDNVVPNLKENDIVNIKQIKTLKKQTKPPSRYNDASLLTSMENAGKFVEEKELQKILKEVTGIGTPATRAGIVEKLLKLDLVKKDKKNFITTELGLKIIKALDDQDVTSPALTAIWGGKLKELENGKYDSNLLYNEIIEYTKKSTLDFINIETLNKDFFKKEENIIGICPKCKNNVIEGVKYYKCKGYKDDCDFIFAKNICGANITLNDAKKILNNEKSNEKTFKYKNGKKGKSSLVLDPNTKNITFDFLLNTSNSKNTKNIIGECPKCKNDFIESKNYYMCSKYKDGCDFIFKKTYGEIDIDNEMAKELITFKETSPKIFIFNNKKVKGCLIIKDWKLTIKR